MPIPIATARIIARPGYFGKRRREFEAEYSAAYGSLWEECWQVKQQVYSFDEAVILYDESYFEFLKKNPTIVARVCAYANCYDHAPSDVQCGVKHDPIATPRHIQDISVRRALIRLGVWFDPAATDLLQIRGPGTDGFTLGLMPGHVPFFDGSLILNPDEGGPAEKWVDEGSVEEFWQRNKVIVRYGA